MIKGIEGILLSSEDAKSLAQFYQDKVGLNIKEEYEMGENSSAFEMESGEGSSFMILDHSEVKGTSKEPQRVMINFEVEDLDKSIDEATGKGVKVVAEKYHIEGYGYVATFEDLDGNFFQFVQIRE